MITIIEAVMIMIKIIIIILKTTIIIKICFYCAVPNVQYLSNTYGKLTRMWLLFCT